MNLQWNVAIENDPANGNVGVTIIAAADSVVIKDLLSPSFARQLAGALLQGADTVAPLPVPDPEPQPVDEKKAATPLKTEKIVKST